MTISYEPTLVMLSIFIAITGSITGLALTAGYHQRYKPRFSFALFKGAVVIGATIWAAHFTAMLATRFPVPVNFDFLETMVPLYVAIIGAALALLAVGGRRLGTASGMIGGTLMGGTIAGMHFLGMDALRGCATVHNAPGVTLTVLVAIAASVVALGFALRKRNTAATLAGGLLLGLTIASVHYLGLAGTGFHSPHAVPRFNMPLISRDVLAGTVAVTALAICGTFVFLFAKLAMRGSGQQSQQGSGSRIRY
jgi:NO-binding membrane sensor protein with MHYT domain